MLSFKTFSSRNRVLNLFARVSFLCFLFNMTTVVADTDDPEWVSANNGKVPKGAFQVGHESNGQELYLCQVNYQGGIHPGKVRTEFKACNIGWGGKEVQVNPYEVLVATNSFGKWSNAKDGEVPAGAFVVGRESDGEKLYLCRGNYQEGVHPGKVRAAFKACNISWGGKEVQVNPYEVLTCGKGDN